MNSSEYLLAARRASAAAGRQFRAIPAADPEVRQALFSEGARQAQLQDIGAQLQLAGRQLDLGERELGLERQGLERFSARLPLATLIGVGTAGVGALSAFANLRQLRRQETALAELGRREALAATARRGELEYQRGFYQQLRPLYEEFLKRQKTPELPL